MIENEWRIIMELVAYFSASGVTKKLASELASHLHADQFEIVPKELYTKHDLNYINPLSRSSKEMRKKDARPEFIKKDLDIQKYEKIYLGFPIWWYTAPRIINTFLEAYDFTNKTIVLFATSGGTKKFGKTIKDLQVSANKAKFIEGSINPKDYSWIK